MKLLTTIIFLFLFSDASVSANDRQEWLSERRKWIERAETVKDPITIESLSRIIRGVGRNLDRASEEGRDLFEQSRSLLISIPGHAEYYRDRINGARERMETLLAAGDEGNYPRARYELSNEVMYGFETLQQLPSVETVQVLGEFLYDERGYVNVTLEDPSEKQRYESSKHSPVYRRSAEALAALPIVGKLEPPRMELGGPDDTKAWKQWYQEIKDGKRTFRFEGDPVEYDLNGPAPKDKVERIARDQTRLAERQAGQRKSVHPQEATMPVADVETSGPKTVGLVLAGSALLASLYWLLRKARRRVV